MINHIYIYILLLLLLLFLLLLIYIIDKNISINLVKGSVKLLHVNECTLLCSESFSVRQKFSQIFSLIDGYLYIERKTGMNSYF